jgi:WhiB family redox-sensing transcriptional regulator
MSWFEYAACKDMDTDDFFPEKGQNIGDLRKVCESCPVRGRCLEYAIKHNLTDGLWGGYSPSQRETIKRKLRQTRAAHT